MHSSRPLSPCVAVLLLAPAALAQADWTDLMPMTQPPARAGHAMAYDSARDQIVMFGGFSGVVVADTWIFDGTDWTHPPVGTSPTARAAHSMAYDPVRQRIVMFGGTPGGGTLFADTWEWDGTTWAQLSPPTTPTARRSHPMVYHPVRGTVVMWGGFAGSDLNDMWEFNGVDWSAIVTANSPTGRRASEMAFDPTSGGLLLFSGYLSPADTWRFDGTDWTQVMPATVPPAMFDHVMATDYLRARIVMLANPGGGGGTWEWTGSDWLQRMPANPPRQREDGYMAWDEMRQRVVMFGGYDGGGYVNDTLMYQTTTPPQRTNYGTGCQGSNNMSPSIGAASGPWLGDSFTVSTSNLATPTAPSVALIGFSNTTYVGAPLPIDLTGIGMTGCALRTSVEGTFPMTSQASIASLTFTVPNVPSIAGAHTYFQSAHLDSPANGLGITASDGLDATLGLK